MGVVKNSSIVARNGVEIVWSVPKYFISRELSVFDLSSSSLEKAAC
jgi:hypothetical protein